VHRSVVIELVEMPVYRDPINTRATSAWPCGRKRAACCVDWVPGAWVSTDAAVDPSSAGLPMILWQAGRLPQDDSTG